MFLSVRIQTLKSIDPWQNTGGYFRWRRKKVPST
jgi:hypothetical protein